jgi:hypothetical protein
VAEWAAAVWAVAEFTVASALGWVAQVTAWADIQVWVVVHLVAAWVWADLVCQPTRMVQDILVRRFRLVTVTRAWVAAVVLTAA